MKKLDNTKLVYSLFDNWPETMILSCLQGVMGEIFVDDLLNPQSAMAKLGREASFAFLAGWPSLDFIESCRYEDIIFVPQSQDWASLIESTYGDRARVFTRYATKKDTLFDIEMLQRFVEQLSNSFSLCQIDEKGYHDCLKEAWSEDLVANYKDYDHYAKDGLGYAIFHQDKLVAGASSYSSYQDGIEIEIDTHPDYRRRGLARVVAAQLILACLDKQLYPSWDAHTKASLSLAEQLGYQLSYEYSAYEIDW